VEEIDESFMSDRGVFRFKQPAKRRIFHEWSFVVRAFYVSPRTQSQDCM
jgi:hypothetical protein